MQIIVTGADGFIGRVLLQHLLETTDARITACDLRFAELPSDPRVQQLSGEFQHPSTLDALFAEGCDALFHLAAVPGGAAEQNPALSVAVNLNATQCLFDRAAATGQSPRVIYASTIAVFGAELPTLVNDQTPIQPSMIYGTHKAMTELALADFHRRAQLEAYALRLPGIVARPPGPSGLKSAFMSNLFHALKAGDLFTVPVSPAATMWMMSVDRVARNMVHALGSDSALMPVGRAVTLPALTVTMQDLVNEICSQTGTSPEQIRYQPDADLEAHFGAYPPLQTPAAERAGFRHDGDLNALVRATLAAL